MKAQQLQCCLTESWLHTLPDLDYIETWDGSASKGPVESRPMHLFTSGEIHELKEELRVLDKSRRKDAVKKVIAAMTVGKDVSPIFPDVVNCMQTDDLELKKLVYLYLINYAKSQPDLAIMAVNTFVKVSPMLLSSASCSDLVEFQHEKFSSEGPKPEVPGVRLDQHWQARLCVCP